MQALEAPEVRARRYRKKAADLRRQADTPGRKLERGDLLSIAEQYDRIADRLAHAAKRPQTLDNLKSMNVV